MTDKIEKYLRKLPRDQRDKVEQAAERIRSGDWSGMAVKQLRGHRALFRVRLGRTRIIFEKDGEYIFILFIGRKSEDTYKHI